MGVITLLQVHYINKTNTIEKSTVYLRLNLQKIKTRWHWSVYQNQYLTMYRWLNVQSWAETERKSKPTQLDTWMQCISNIDCQGKLGISNVSNSSKNAKLFLKCYRQNEAFMKVFMFLTNYGQLKISKCPWNNHQKWSPLIPPFEYFVNPAVYLLVYFQLSSCSRTSCEHNWEGQ